MRYFDQYKRAIEAGDIVVGKYVKQAIKRVEYFRTKYKFYQGRADRRINFIEKECSQTKGSNDMLKLALPQKVWLEVSWGFYYDAEIVKKDPETMEEYTTTEERRLINETALVIARGSGKTTLGSAIGEVLQIIDGEHGADVQLMAFDNNQASYLFEASRAMTNNKRSVLYNMREADILTSTKQGMLFRPTNSLMRIKTSEYERLDGTNAHGNIFDEVHTYDDERLIKVVNDGSRKKRKNWQTWYITTNGTKREKVFDKQFKFWTSVLDGEVDNDHVMPWIYTLDSHDEIHDPSTWQKSMPLLGITTTPEIIAQEIEDAKNDPAQQAEIMAKTFNLPVNNYLAYFTNEEAQGSSDNFDAALFIGSDIKKARAVIGIDLSDVNDISSISFMVAEGDRFYFLNRKYLPRSRVEELPPNQKSKYLEWEAKGDLVIHDLDYNDQSFIFADLRAFMSENNVFPVAVGYDKWNAREIIRLFQDYYGDVAIEIPQTVKTLSNPLKIYKEKIKHGKIVFDDPVATWNHLNVMVKVDANGNIFPNKEKAKDKIDVFASQLDAFVAYHMKKDELEQYFS